MAMPALRTVFIASALITTVLLLLPLQILALLFRWPLQRQVPLLFHRVACMLIGIRIKVIGTPPCETKTLIVSNHSSWIDIPAISATIPVVFIAKHEISRWPVFGLLARLQRAVFVDRQKRHATGRVNDQVARRLIDGDHVVLFAEGTSSDGTRVLPFKSALIGAAGHALVHDNGRSHVRVQPLSIAYVSRHGIQLGRHDRPHIAWYGNMPLLPHLMRVLGKGNIDLTLTWGEPIHYGSDSDRKVVARELERAVRNLTSMTLRAGAQV
jgi:1-acyl-sn-glycerol-3-phosphate acyltransferase